VQQASELRPQDGRLRAHISQLLHSGRASWWFGLLAATGVTQFLSAIVLLMVFPSFMTAFLHKQQPDLTERQILFVLVLSVLLAATVPIHNLRTMKGYDLGEPPRRHIPREWWHIFATGTGAIVAVGTAYTTFLMWMFLLLGLVKATRVVLPFFGLPGHYLLQGSGVL
jgi:hypothetical protein